MQAKRSDAGAYRTFLRPTPGTGGQTANAKYKAENQIKDKSEKRPRSKPLTCLHTSHIIPPSFPNFHISTFSHFHIFQCNCFTQSAQRSKGAKQNSCCFHIFKFPNFHIFTSPAHIFVPNFQTVCNLNKLIRSPKEKYC